MKKKYFRTAKCKKCGKEFIPAPFHIYKDGGKYYYCSWTCFNHRKDKVKEDTAYEDNQNKPTPRACVG